MVKTATYTFVVDKNGKVISVTKNGVPMEEKPGHDNPNFGEVHAPDELLHCIGLGGVVRADSEEDVCRYIWGKWF